MKPLHRHPANIKQYDQASFGDRMADKVANGMGSWAFIGIQTAIILSWIIFNAFIAIQVIHGHPFDPFPFILLNLVFSTQAAYAAPILQLASNRQADHDRARAESDFHTNQLALSGIRSILMKLQAEMPEGIDDDNGGK
jgi:uncharacterized membrane protein